MGRGIELYGLAGNLQASTDRYTMGLSGHSSLLMTDTGMTHPQPRVRGQIVVSGVNPYVVVYPPQGKAVFIERCQPISGGFRITFGAVSSQPVAFQYWVYDVPSAAFKDPALASMGVQVFDPNFVVTYDAATDTLEPVALVEIPTPPSQAGATDGSVNYDRYSLVDLRSVTIPAGRKYGVIFSGFANIQCMQDTGQYASGSGYPNDVPSFDPDGTDGPTGNYQWRRMQLDTLWSGCLIEGDQLFVGNSFIEQFEGWYPIGQEEHLNTIGKSRFMIVDITNLSSTGLPENPNAPVVNASATERKVSINGPTQTTYSPQVTLSISGGAGPYTVKWERVSGSTTVVAYGSSTSTTFQTQVFNQQPSTTHTAIWRARVVSATNVVGYSPEVTFIHEAGAYSVDLVPDAVSFSPITINSPEPDVAWVGSARTITGINQPITLRVERYSYNGNLDGAMVDVVVRDAAGVEKFNSYFDAKGTGLAYLDVTVQNGWSVGYYAHAVTNSGRKSATWNMVVWNLSNPGGSVQISSQPVSAVVDNDDNFNIPDDFVPNAVNWSNISGSTNDASFFLANPEQTISGVNKPIVIRATITNVVKSSNIISNSRLDFQRDGVYVHDTSGIGNGFWTQATLTSGQVCRFIAHAGTSAGTGTLSYTVTVTNQSTGGTVLDTFTVNQTVDADNNHNVAPTPDYTPNAISVGNLSLNTNEPSGLTNASFFQITGINQQITVQFTRGNQWDSGGIFTRRLYIYHSKTGSGGPWTEYFIGAGAQGVANIAATNGDWFYVQAFCDTTAGIGQTSFNGYVTNATTGVQLASYSVTGTVDADNNYNVTDVTPDPISLNNMSLETNENIGWTNISGPVQITGINQPVKLYAGISGRSGGVSAGTVFINKGPSAGGPWTTATGLSTANGGVDAVEWTMNNGEWFYIHVSAETYAGRKSGSFTVGIHNASTGYNVIAGCNVSLTVDADNNFNVPAGGVTPRNWEDISHGYTSNNGSSSTPNYRLGAAQTISGLASGQTATISLTGTAEGSAMAFVEIFKNGVNQGNRLYSPEGSTSVQTYAGVTVQNGDTIAFRCGIGGRLAQSWEGTVWQDKSLNVNVNASPGGLIDTFSFYGSYSDTAGGGGGGPIEI